MRETVIRHAQTIEVPPYHALAEIYDAVMSHIDYEVWVGYVEKMCTRRRIAPESTLDISCGTGRAIPYLQPWCRELYCMDQSVPMIRELYRNFPEMQNKSWVGEMSHLPTNRKFDLILNIQDSLNYYTKTDRITEHIGNVHAHLNPGGAFVFDFSTDENIKNNFIDMDEYYDEESFGYERVNTYMPRKRLNLTEFFVWQNESDDPEVLLEKHLQRMYTKDEIEACLRESLFEQWFMYEDETLDPPSEKSERIHIIAIKQSV
ncbi:MAG: dTDP-3-amino-3,4,6-trideoxy-alpha-D-glucopyranose [Candidatus Marinimicrobia bacterium]|nr:dTDP-3-amino-3,4,6-trideoxy-alpha-D-glucopyranose [Candidatus Neomarinimicrobiota bacterium]